VAARLTTLTHAAGATLIDSFAYTLDQAGRRTSVTTPAGKESYTLDATGRLTGVTYPDGSTAAYTYDAAGNRTTQTVGASTTSYTYDSAGRLTNAGSAPITYNADGEVVGVAADTYSYDSAGRMVAATVGGTSYTNTYDGDGTRVRLTAGANSTNYLVDRTAALPQVVSNGTTSYVRGESGAILSDVSAGGTMLPITDGLGSVRRLVDTTGTSFGVAGYDVFGATRSGAGSVGAFGFTGEQTDPTGLLFLRARQYNPSFGRFMSPDAGIGASGSLGTNPYIYAADNPVNLTDPSGRFAEPALIEEADIEEITVAKGISTWVKIVIGLVILALTGGITACLAFHAWVCQALAKPPSPTKPHPTPGATSNPTGAPDLSALQQQAAAEAAMQQSKADQCKATNPTGPVNDPTSPCGRPGLKIFFPGADTWATTNHDLNAIAGYPLWGYLVKSPGAGEKYRNWYDQARFYPQDSSNPCFRRQKGVIACDEYPFYKTIEGGPFVWPLPSLATTSLTESNTQGAHIKNFYYDPECGLVDYDVIRGGYFVIPTLIAPKTFWICNK
jgi:RHS repeat-associated protein